MSGDRIDECKRTIDRLKSEIVYLCMDIATGCDLRLMVTPEAMITAAKVLQLKTDVRGRAKEAYRLALEMVQLVKETPDDPRASVIQKIAELLKGILEVSSVNSMSPMAQERREQLFEQYDELSMDYRYAVANFMSGNRIDKCKREIDRLKSEIIPLCEEIDKIGTGSDRPEDSERSVQLCREVLRLSSASYSFAFEMVHRLPPGDPLARVIAKIADVTLESVQVAMKLVMVIETKQPNVPQIDIAALDPKPIVLAEMQLSLMDVESDLLRKKRDRLFETYDYLSGFYENRLPNDGMGGDGIDQSKRAIDRLKSEIIPLGSEIDRIATTTRAPYAREENIRLVARVVHLNEEIHEREKEAHRYASEASVRACELVDHIKINTK